MKKMHDTEISFINSQPRHILLIADRQDLSWLLSCWTPGSCLLRERENKRCVINIPCTKHQTDPVPLYYDDHSNSFSYYGDLSFILSVSHASPALFHGDVFLVYSFTIVIFVRPTSATDLNQDKSSATISLFSRRFTHCRACRFLYA